MDGDGERYGVESAGRWALRSTARTRCVFSIGARLAESKEGRGIEMMKELLED